jgi:hypothetical protein
MLFKKNAFAQLACIAALFAAMPAIAQEADDKIPIYRLDLLKRPDIPTGEAAFVAGKAGSVPHRFFLENLYMLKPISVTVRAVNPGDVVTAKITKWKFDDVLREGDTADGKQVLFKFRTHGEFQISITAEKPDTPYKMVVWVGPDIKPKSKRLFVPKSEFKDTSGLPKWVWWAGGGAAAVIIALLAVILRRKRVS